MPVAAYGLACISHNALMLSVPETKQPPLTAKPKEVAFVRGEQSVLLAHWQQEPLARASYAAAFLITAAPSAKRDRRPGAR